MATEPDPAALVESADAALVRGEVQAGMAALTEALRAFEAVGDTRGSAMTCAKLGHAYETFTTNRTAARVWFARAARLLEHEPACIEQGWVALAGLGCDVDDPATLAARASLALERARTFGDLDLEAKALADGGLAAVQFGEVREGMGMLDEALALWCGPANDQVLAVKGVCSFFTACYYAADFDRATHWVEDLRRLGLIGPSPGGALFLNSHCAAVQATALMEIGRWGEAESVLLLSKSEFEACMPIPSWHPAIALADLRLRQGRLVEAEQLLLGKDSHLQALLPTARLHLERGEVELAHATATRGLRMVCGDRLRGVELLACIAEADLAAGRLEAASEAGAAMAERCAGLPVPRLEAETLRVRSRVQAASGDFASAISSIEQAAALVPDGLPVIRLSLILDLVRLHEQVGNRAAAAVEAGRAASLLSALDVSVPAGDAELLDRFAPRSSGHIASRAALVRDTSGWQVHADGMRVRLPTTKGIRYLAELLKAPGVERHALDLVDVVEGVSADGPDRHALGDVGEVIDARARRAYRQRIEFLRSETEEALDLGNSARADALQAECDQLIGQLAAAFGLGGRRRHAGSVAERARLNVTRSLRTAIARIQSEVPEAGASLDRQIRTGLYCAFEPEDSDGVSWSVHSAVNHDVGV